jgi:hypothetical protein
MQGMEHGHYFAAILLEEESAGITGIIMLTRL